MSSERSYSKALFGFCLLGWILAVAVVITTFVFVRVSDVSVDLIKFIACFHPVTLHLPIGTISVLFLMELLTVFMRRRSLLAGKMIVLAFTVITVAVAACTGLLLAKTGGYSGELLDDHRQEGLILAGLISAAAFFRLIYYASEKRAAMFVYVVLLISSVGVMALAGHSGGGLTHGATFLTKYQPAWLGGKVESDGGDGPVQTVLDASGVMQIFSEKCVSCHGADKQKGGYRLDTREFSFTTGDSGEEPIVEGNSMGSYLVRLITLQSDDPDVMPPEGKAALTEAEILEIIHWIDAGAPWQEGASVEQAEAVEAPPASSDVTPTPEKVGAPPSAGPAPALVPGPLVYRSQPALVEQEGGIFVTELESGAVSVHLNAEHRKDPDAHDLLKALTAYAGKVEQLNVVGAQLSAETWAGLAGLEGLKMLNAAYTNLGDSELAAFQGSASLVQLNLHGATVSLSGLEKLASNPNLRRIWVNEIELLNSDVDKLRAAMPDCDIIFK
ncbi:MAG: putative membrane protein/mono/diheme cytochrome c family protein [Kiritimatiellia bacterium]|jgi:uncharacterized membrane protein/mono/diheme cytochrome c family protein